MPRKRLRRKRLPRKRLPRKWFVLVSEDGSALSLATSVTVDIEDVDMFRKAVKEEFRDSCLAGISPPDLKVFENRVAYEAEQALNVASSIRSFGRSVRDALIVQVPQRAGVASGSQDLKDLIKASVGEVMDEREQKRSVYSLSDLNSVLGQRIKNKMGLREECLDFDEPVDTSIGGYQWISNVAESEASHRAGYMAYLRLHLKTLIDRRDFQLVDIANDKSLLSIVDPRLPFRMNGTADVLLVKRRAKITSNMLAGVSLVINIKKKIDPSHFSQALGQLASSSLKAPLHCYPMSLLTDLNDKWHFSWFNRERILAHVSLTHPKNALDFIVAAVSEGEGSVPFRVPFIPPPLKRLRVDDFMPRPSDGADEMMERYELMADELEPEFLAERRMEYAHHLVQSMPMYAHMYA